MTGNKHIWIDRTEELDRIIPDLEKEARVAVDLEADSMFHFREMVCLIQIATPEVTVLIDTLKVKDLNCLKPMFANPSVEKILHGSDYDVRSLYRDFEITINNLFDTELASRFMGIRETGLGSVLANRFAISLDKKFQKKDWSQRPLPREMIEYGARDVLYLLPLADQLKSELIGKNRLSWVVEECEHQSRVRPALTDEEPLFLKVRGAGRLDRRSLAVLEKLLQYRLLKASQMNRPPFKILGNSAILDLAMKKPRNMEFLRELKILSPRQTDLFSKGLLTAVKGAMEVPEEGLPLYPHQRTPKIKPSVVKRIERLKTYRDQKAAELDMDPSLILSKAVIGDIAMKKPLNGEALHMVKGIRNWQKIAFGEEIIRCLSVRTATQSNE